jgi:lysophospholipase L1-like esterase
MSAAGFTDQTVRDIVYPAIGGRAVRVRFSNAYGKQPLVIGSASIGIDSVGARVVPGTLRALRFGGKPSVRIPVGAQVTSDPLSFTFKASQDLAVSLFLPGATGPATYHQEAQQDNFVSGPGDFSLDPFASGYPTTTMSWFYLDGVDVIPADRAVLGSVVSIGDSITDGATVGVDTNDRWPNILGDRLAAADGPTLSAVDEGIGGNRVLTGSACFGTSALDRFTRDVLDQPGVRDVILFEGVNDLGFSQTDPVGYGPLGPCFLPATDVSAQQVIDGYRQLIAAAHARGLRIFGATITPFGNSFYWDAAAEAKRDTINSWIRSSGAFDGVIDFARVLADPGDPDLMNPAYDSGDHLHPTDTGYIAMGDAVNLGMLIGR